MDPYGDSRLIQSLWDSRAGKNGKSSNGTGVVGLRNIRERLESYYGKKANLTLEIKNGKGTEAAIDLTIKSVDVTTN